MQNKWPTPVALNSKPMLPVTLIGGRYRPLYSLGKGVLGEVFLAEDTEDISQKKVAVKLLHQDLLFDAEALRELENEAAVMRRLKHANILQLLDYKINATEVFIVTEYAAGGTLADILRPDPDLAPQPLPLDRVQHYLEQLGDALALLHRINLVHRDLKPQNILLDDHDNIKLADFSLVMQVDTWAPGMVIHTEAAWGTPFYAAPEVWHGKIGKVTDIYALGVIAYQMITGSTPYQGTPEELKEQHLHAPIPQLAKHALDVNYPVELDDLIADALAKDPDLRISTVDLFCNRFNQILQSHPDATNYRASATHQPTNTNSQALSLSQKLANNNNGGWPATGTTGTPHTGGSFSWWGNSSVKSSSVATSPSATSSTSSSNSVSSGCAGIFWGILAVFFIVLLVSVTSSKKSNRTVNLSTPPAFPTTPIALTDKSLLTMRWHQDRLISVFWDPYAYKKYPGITLGQYFYGIDNSANGAGWDSTGKGFTPIIKDKNHIMSRINVAAFSSTGYRAVVGNSYDILIVGADKDASESGVWAKGHLDTVRALAWSPNGEILASGSNDRTVALWSVEGKLLLSIPATTAQPTNLAWSGDNKLLAVAYTDGNVSIYEINSEKSEDAPDGTKNIVKIVQTTKLVMSHPLGVNSMAWNPATNVLATASDDRTVRLWSAKGEFLNIMTNHTAIVTAVAWSPDGSYLVSGSFDRNVIVYNQDGRYLRTLPGHSAGVTSVAWSPDGRYFASGSIDKTIRLWSR